MIEPVKLNEEEKVLFDQIEWNTQVLLGYELSQRLEILECVGQLAESLVRRRAIPTVRLKIFTDPDMNPGRGRKSWQAVFEDKGLSKKEILRHTHFMPFLSYFIFGPNLPAETIERFEEFANGMESDVSSIASFVKREIKNRIGSQGNLGEEFYRLAHELGFPEYAESVRKAANSVP